MSPSVLQILKLHFLNHSLNPRPPIISWGAFAVSPALYASRNCTQSSKEVWETPGSPKVLSCLKPFHFSQNSELPILHGIPQDPCLMLWKCGCEVLLSLWCLHTWLSLTWEWALITLTHPSSLSQINPYLKCHCSNIIIFLWPGVQFSKWVFRFKDTTFILRRAWLWRSALPCFFRRSV